MEGAALLVPVAAISAARRWTLRQGATEVEHDMARGDVSTGRGLAAAWPTLIRSATSPSLEADKSADRSFLKQGREIAPQGLSKMAQDLHDLVSEAVSNIGGGAAKERETEVPAAHEDEALKILSEFCEDYPAVRVEPTAAELDALWARCRHLHPSAVATGVCEQLSWDSGTSEWQQRLRSLHVLEHFAAQGGPGEAVAREVCEEAEDILRHLVMEVPQCRTVALRILAAQSLADAKTLAVEKLYLVDSPELSGTTNGLAFRLQKRRKCKDTLTQGPRWGTTIRGVDEGDGWVRVGERYLPLSLGGKPVLVEQEEDLTDDTSTGSQEHGSDCGAASDASSEASNPPVPLPAAVKNLLVEEEASATAADLDGLIFHEEALEVAPVPSLNLAPRPAPKPATAEQMQQYLWLSSVETALNDRPDPFAFASEHAFQRGAAMFAL